jgi:DNA invertase Pin-like site-specific DNA recombinase
MSKINASHFERQACVYIRQSTSAQVLHHTESTERQYALAGRAASLGWPEEAITVIRRRSGEERFHDRGAQRVC